jgi:hypothetical protein
MEKIQITSEDIRESRKRVDDAYQLIKETYLLTDKDFEVALKKVHKQTNAPSRLPACGK